ncbi:hypothetical protein SAMN05720606_109176 [Paenibacillus polysaccharolyticus]|uniref:Nucleotidyl transferase AbiEii toxin, Type IV TA system n=1 Tax=Paenibacillus polysaccharolyticus TaxID=582692 RepID=A0A1G5IUQ4_9BACL|nr:hypothetical protein [Paenibacillus polysaccharolyticus]SCY79604.1 hypothetical protein SAMN05720606_109176 [Paenibacillus polysaccharolyticus]
MIDPQEILPVVKRLEANHIAYSLGGSAMLCFLGLVDSVNDWDLMVDCPKFKFIEVIAGYEWIEKESGDKPFASEYRMEVESLNVDVIGGFAFDVDGRRLELPISPIRNVKWHGMHVSSPEVWYVAYQMMGRHEKADLILDYLQTSNEYVNQDLIKSLLANDILTYGIRKGLNTLLET